MAVALLPQKASVVRGFGFRRERTVGLSRNECATRARRNQREREKGENECGRDEPERQRANKHFSLRGTTMTCLPVVTMLRSLWRCVNLSYCPWFGNTESGRSVRSSEVRQNRARPVHPSSTTYTVRTTPVQIKAHALLEIAISSDSSKAPAISLGRHYPKKRRNTAIIGQSSHSYQAEDCPIFQR